MLFRLSNAHLSSVRYTRKKKVTCTGASNKKILSAQSGSNLHMIIRAPFVPETNPFFIDKLSKIL